MAPGGLNLLEPSEPVQACNGIAVACFRLPLLNNKTFITCYILSAMCVRTNGSVCVVILSKICVQLNVRSIMQAVSAKSSQYILNMPKYS
jgi:hypothetical protein